MKLVSNRIDPNSVTIALRRKDLVGQGFADELFGVFQRRHPHTKIETSNTNAAVEAMNRHVIQTVGAS